MCSITFGQKSVSTVSSLPQIQDKHNLDLVLNCSTRCKGVICECWQPFKKTTAETRRAKTTTVKTKNTAPDVAHAVPL